VAEAGLQTSVSRNRTGPRRGIGYMLKPLALAVILTVAAATAQAAALPYDRSLGPTCSTKSPTAFAPRASRRAWP